MCESQLPQHSKFLEICVLQKFKFFFLRLLGKYLPQVQYKVDLHLGFFVLQFLCLGRLKRQQTSDGLRFLHRSCIRTKRNGGLLLREKQVWQLSTRLNKPLTAQRRGHRLIETSNHCTKNLKSLKNMVCWQASQNSNYKNAGNSHRSVHVVRSPQ